jgi:hypothetical protein
LVHYSLVEKTDLPSHIRCSLTAALAGNLALTCLFPVQTVLWYQLLDSGDIESESPVLNLVCWANNCGKDGSSGGGSHTLGSVWLDCHKSSLHELNIGLWHLVQYGKSCGFPLMTGPTAGRLLLQESCRIELSEIILILEESMLVLQGAACVADRWTVSNWFDKILQAVLILHHRVLEEMYREYCYIFDFQVTAS